MFFCEPCREARNWPGFVPNSRGKCEVCGKKANCYDVPSRLLPTPKAVS